MSLVGLLFARFLEAMFVIGTIGSVAVLVLSGIEDFKTLFGREESDHT